MYFKSSLAAALLTCAMLPGHGQSATIELDIASCIKPMPDGVPAPLFDRLGNLHHPIIVNGEDAQKYFDQGLTLIYAFNHPEAIHSFVQVTRDAPRASMPYWGIALAAGRDINGPATPSCQALAHDSSRVALNRAFENLKSVDPDLAKQIEASGMLEDVENGNIEALKKIPGKIRRGSRMALGEFLYATAVRFRYLDRGGAPKAGNYVTAMEFLHGRFPNDQDAATLYADALMNVDAWHWWDMDKPSPEIATAIEVLKGVLRDQKNHLGAHHLYIHAWEQSPTPIEALDSARALPGLAPAAGHLVHMPSHIYERIGKHHEATKANEAAVAADKAYIDDERVVTARYPLHYLTHNQQFLAWSQAIEAKGAASRQTADALVGTVNEYSNDYNKEHNPGLVKRKRDAVDIVPSFVGARFLAWGRPRPGGHGEGQSDSKTPFTDTMKVYTESLTYFASEGATLDGITKWIIKFKGKIQETEKQDPKLKYGENDAKDLFKIAQCVQGARAMELASMKGDSDKIVEQAAKKKPSCLDPDADLKTDEPTWITFWKTGVGLEDKLAYSEPRDWYYPIRQSLGAALFRQKQQPYYQAAENIFREHTTHDPGNCRSLFGLIESLTAQGKEISDKLTKAKDEACKNADIKLNMNDL